MSRVRVKRKGQVTIPLELRSKLGIEEGTLLSVEEAEGSIVLKLAPPLKGGEVVGVQEHERIIRELDKMRRKWR